MVKATARMPGAYDDGRSARVDPMALPIDPLYLRRPQNGVGATFTSPLSGKTGPVP
jgi:hypothetical protein